MEQHTIIKLSSSLPEMAIVLELCFVEGHIYGGISAI